MNLHHHYSERLREEVKGEKPLLETFPEGFQTLLSDLRGEKF